MNACAVTQVDDVEGRALISKIGAGRARRVSAVVKAVHVKGRRVHKTFLRARRVAPIDLQAALILAVLHVLVVHSREVLRHLNLGNLRREVCACMHAALSAIPYAPT